MTTQEQIEALKAELAKLERQHEMEQLAQQLATHGAELQNYSEDGDYYEDCSDRAKLLLAAATKPLRLFGQLDWCEAERQLFGVSRTYEARNTTLLRLLIPDGYSKPGLINGLRAMLKFAEQPKPPKPRPAVDEINAQVSAAEDEINAHFAALKTSTRNLPF